MKDNWFRFGLFEDDQDDGEEKTRYDYAREVLAWITSKLGDEGYEFKDIIRERWGMKVDFLQQPYTLYVRMDSAESVETLDVEKIVWKCSVLPRSTLWSGFYSASKLSKGEGEISNRVIEILAHERKHTIIHKQE